MLGFKGRGRCWRGLLIQAEVGDGEEAGVSLLLVVRVGEVTMSRVE